MRVNKWFKDSNEKSENSVVASIMDTVFKRVIKKLAVVVELENPAEHDTSG
jgi:hypothetical protein